LPEPLKVVSVIHAALLVAVHAQPTPAVTLVEPLPPATTKFCDTGKIENVQPPLRRRRRSGDATHVRDVMLVG